MSNAVSPLKYMTGIEVIQLKKIHTQYMLHQNPKGIFFFLLQEKEMQLFSVYILCDCFDFSTENPEKKMKVFHYCPKFNNK